MTLQQLVTVLRREIAAGGQRRARALPIAQRLQAAAYARVQPRTPPRRPPPRPRFNGAAEQARSGDELSAGVHSYVAPIANEIVPGSGQVIDAVFSVLAPVLDTSLASVQCRPGNPNYPACAIPGGSASALVAAGMSPAQANAIVADVIANGPSGGGGGDPLLRPALREN